MASPNEFPEVQPGAVNYRVYQNADLSTLMKDINVVLTNRNWRLEGGIAVTVHNGHPLYAQAVTGTF
jgi:hypothetical protein